MIGCYDQRPIDEIGNELMATNQDDIDVVAILCLLCRTLADLTNDVEQLKKQVEK